MKTILQILIAIILISSNTIAQDFQFTMQDCFYRPNDVEGKCIIETKQGYLLGLDEEKSWIIHNDSEGNQIWQKEFGGSNGELPKAFLKISDEEYLLLATAYSDDGDVQSYNHGGGDFWLVRFNIEGEIIWEKCFGSPGLDLPRGMILTDDNYILAWGEIWGDGGDVSEYYGMSDSWLIKVDLEGNLIWEKTIGNQGNNKPVDVIQNQAGNYMIVGDYNLTGGMITCVPHTGYVDAIMIELDPEGNIIQQAGFGGFYYDTMYTLAEVENGYICLTASESFDGDVIGSHSSENNIKPDIWVTKHDHNLNLIWQKCLGGTGSDYPRNIHITKDNKFLVFGFTKSLDGDVVGNHQPEFNPYGMEDVWVVQLSAEGNLDWQRPIGSYANDRISNVKYSVLLRDDYDWVILGTTECHSDDEKGDMQCNFSQNSYENTWLFELKDCGHYQTTPPITPIGADTLCSQDSISYFTTEAVEYADHYAWLLQPSAAGSISGDSLQATLIINPDYQGTATLTVKAVNDCGQSDWSEPHYVEVQNCTGINEYANRYGLRVYPNPAYDFVIFTVDGRHRACPVPTTPTTVKITNLYGQIITTFPLDKQEIRWDVSNLPKGVYFYSILIDNNALQGKIIIQ